MLVCHIEKKLPLCFFYHSRVAICYYAGVFFFIVACDVKAGENALWELLTNKLTNEAWLFVVTMLIEIFLPS